ncbi:MAG: prolipoprotein diacylglyceryl transferase [Actinobacteria bacterium]|nr:prolipoprotein diacylglyceryl transferase [Actinomycetota bacterium]
MHPELFHIGGITIYSYGVFLALGFIVAALVGRRRLEEMYRNPDILLDLVLAAVVGGILGARLFYILGHWSYYMANKGEIFKFNMDGLVFYGGLIFGLLFTFAVGRLRHVRVWTIMDLCGLCVPLAMAITRIGCFMNGCCYGKTTSMPWGITFPELVGARHPTQIYELILDLALFAFLWYMRDKFTREGMAFFVFVMGYSTIRFTMEFFRGHSAANAALFFQLLSIAFFVAAGIVVMFRDRILPEVTTATESL